VTTPNMPPAAPAAAPAAATASEPAAAAPATDPDAVPTDNVAMVSLNADGSSAQRHEAVVIIPDAADPRPAGMGADAAATAAATIEGAGGTVAE
jgi:hypothetical protein